MSGTQSAYICPVCKDPLGLYDKTYRCGKGHCFDISAKGYVNLLLSKGRNPAKSGDNKLMVKARSDFLDSGHYEPLANRVAALINKYVSGKDEPIVIDSGCGEGYYTLICAKATPEARFFGIDISKTAAAKGASRSKAENVENAMFAAASGYSLPFADSSADVLCSIFAPVADKEYSRVLEPEGRLIVVSPGARHLFALKALLYDEPYENKPNDYALKCFELEAEEQLDYSVTLRSSKEIGDLFTMTPYYYKTPQSAIEKINNTESLVCECSFVIQTYRKIKQV